ncbi:MAG: hypothetical protein MRZ79_04725 [Bacteroidia bacterium]|nr:hypothetical protein [Bacteroidia bacterium]
MAKTIKLISKINLSKQDLSDARKGGFRKKQPKKPATSKMKTADKVNAYVERYNNWAKEAKARAKAYREGVAEAKRVKEHIQRNL